jgi:hypothetical protein
MACSWLSFVYRFVSRDDVRSVDGRESCSHIQRKQSRAAKKLAKIEAKQAKEYQELFTPTCTKIDSEPIVTETPDLNAVIMDALSEKRADGTSADQATRKVNDGEVYESTLETRNGIAAKNTLSVRGIDAVQVSTHRGPPTDRPTVYM